MGFQGYFGPFWAKWLKPHPHPTQNTRFEAKFLVEDPVKETFLCLKIVRFSQSENMQNWCLVMGENLLNLWPDIKPALSGGNRTSAYFSLFKMPRNESVTLTKHGISGLHFDKIKLGWLSVVWCLWCDLHVSGKKSLVHLAHSLPVWIYLSF